LHTSRWRRPKSFNRYARASVALSDTASIRRRYGKCWLNGYQLYYHWGECTR
jgi:hypothetical protein